MPYRSGIDAQHCLWSICCNRTAEIKLDIQPFAAFSLRRFAAYLLLGRDSTCGANVVARERGLPRRPYLEPRRTMSSSSRGVAVTILKLMLGLAFLAIAAVKLTGSMQTPQMFANIGWGQWFRYFTGALDLIGAILVLVPRSAFYGALLLMCTVGFAVVLTFAGRIHDSPLAPLVLTVIAAMVAWLTRPGVEHSSVADPR